MGIKVICTCGQTLNVKDSLAGKRGRCPHCGNVILIPSLEIAAETKSPSAPAPITASPAPSEVKEISSSPGPSPSEEVSAEIPTTSPDLVQGLPAEYAAPDKVAPQEDDVQIAQAASEPKFDDRFPPGVTWYLGVPNKGEKGPLETSVLLEWLQQKKVQSDWLIWRGGWGQWQPVVNFFSAGELNGEPIHVQTKGRAAAALGIPAAVPLSGTSDSRGEATAATEGEKSGEEEPPVKLAPRNKNSFLIILSVFLAILLLALIPLMVKVLWPYFKSE